MKKYLRLPRFGLKTVLLLMVVAALVAMDLRVQLRNQAALEDFAEQFPSAEDHLFFAEPLGIIAMYDRAWSWVGVSIDHRRLDKVYLTELDETSLSQGQYDAIAKLSAASHYSISGVSLDCEKLRLSFADSAESSLELERCNLMDSSIGDLSSKELKYLRISNCSNVRCDTELGKTLPNLQQLQVLNSSNVKSLNLGMLTRLRTLELNGSAAQSDILNNLGQLTQLEELSISNGTASDACLNGIGQLLQLRNVQLESLPISDLVLEEISKCPKLETLALTDCKFVTDDGIKHLKGHSAIRILDLSGLKQITSESATVISSLTKLRNLQLQGTSMTAAAWPHLIKLSELTQLSVDGRCFTADDVCGLVDTAVATLSYKTSDWLGWNNLSRSTIELLAGRQRSDSQQIRLDYIQGLEAKHLEAWTGMIKRVSLRGCQIDESVMERISQMKSLDDLDLSCTNVTSEMLTKLDCLSKIQTLNLERCKLDANILKVLKQIPSLKRVELGGTGLTYP